MRLKTARVALVFVGHYGSSILSLQFGEALPAAHACTYTLLEYNRTQRCTLYTWTCFEYLLIVYLAGGWEGVTRGIQRCQGEAVWNQEWLMP